MVKGSIGDRILECIGYPESWTEQEIEDNKRVIQEEFSKIDSHVVKAVVARLCDKIEEPKIKKEKEEAERQKKAEIARRIRMERSVRSTLGSVISQMRKITMTHAIKIIHTWNQIPIWR